MRKITRILEVPFDALTMKEAVQKGLELMRSEKPCMVCTPNPEIVMEAQTDKELMNILRESDMVIPDGIGVVLASKYSDIQLKERVAGFDFTQNLFSEVAKSGETIYFFGGAPKVAEVAAKRMMERYKGLRIVGVQDGYFDAEKEKHILEDIKSKSPDILLVGLGAPKQEKWMYHHLEELGIGLAIGVGGSFDVMAGKVKRAPKLFQKLGLEWFYRLVTQPTRWRRMMQLPVFAWTVWKSRKWR
ncbi:WecB/TagA/CpsF family glycosyltransferase [Chakrabartyella piscis]|uniref:WecB/TagA/CpsF family glycosyltransferase n=1 Tax=Chakrabartyella piscis TaxID=2918914 RepID=UPI0029586607|nr:WecB/TagA/CpsF family glycosyltransferase [Chakrabartyella piscis]